MHGPSIMIYLLFIRGYGLFIGLEIVTGRENPQADSVTAQELVKRLPLSYTEQVSYLPNAGFSFSIE